MSIANDQNGLPSAVSSLVNGNRQSHLFEDGPARTQTPVDNAMTLMPEASDMEEDSRRAQFAELFRKSDARLARLFQEDGSYDCNAIESLKHVPILPPPILPVATDRGHNDEPPRKKLKRVIDEDDYGDDDQDDEADEQESPLKAKSAHAAAAKSLLSPSKSGSSPVQSISSPSKQTDRSKEDGSQGQAKTTEDARKELEEARIATEEAAKRSFHTLFYTLENDRTAMLEQQQLEESEKQLQAEMDKNNSHPTSHGSGENHGSLSTANLGASSLTLKHLIARIDLKRDKVRASDAELRSLMNEVRKNRSKWASEDNVGQEELYEAVEKVLSELKAHTEYSTPFLQRVNKRDAPDYYNSSYSLHGSAARLKRLLTCSAVIKHPMDLGSMTKKLKSLSYKSKAEFVTDLNLIWDNCLRYNQEMSHPLRRMANGMRKEAEKLIPLIPDLVIRPRAEVEAEERRKQNGGDDDAGDDSDDEPIMSSRGRKTTGTKGTNKSRKAVGDQKESTPTTEQKPFLQLNGLLAKANREGSEIDGSNGISTPPVCGSITPGGIIGNSGLGSNIDAMDIDDPTMNDMALGHALGEAADQAYEDDEYRVWKQVTKKDRATLAKERFQLFRGDKLNVDEPALLRSKAGMRRQMKAKASAAVNETSRGDTSAATSKETQKPTETLAEGMETEGDRAVPDYYEPQSVIPAIAPKLQWTEDGEGQVINQHEEFLRMVPPGFLTAPSSHFTKKFDSNIHQMQETRKLCSKISVIKQMQIQTQVSHHQLGVRRDWSRMLMLCRFTPISSQNTIPNPSTSKTSSLTSFLEMAWS
jgi:transcriptional activator SPT7